MNVKTRQLPLMLVLLVEVGAVWSIYCVQNRWMRVLLTLSAVVLAAGVWYGQHLRWIELWWMWPLIVFVIAATAMFALAAVQSVGAF